MIGWSRIPWLDDRQWAERVRRLQRGWEPAFIEDVHDPDELAQQMLSYVELTGMVFVESAGTRKALEELVKRPQGKTYQLDKKAGATWTFYEGAGDYCEEAGLTMDEIKQLRFLFHQPGVDVDDLLEMYGISQETLDALLDGTIAPQCGGPLRKAPYGIGEIKSERAKRFIKGVLVQAQGLLHPDEYEAMHNQNGVTEDEMYSLLTNFRVRDEREHRFQYRRRLQHLGSTKRKNVREE